MPPCRSYESAPGCPLAQRDEHGPVETLGSARAHLSPPRPSAPEQVQGRAWAQALCPSALETRGGPGPGRKGRAFPRRLCAHLYTWGLRTTYTTPQRAGPALPRPRAQAEGSVSCGGAPRDRRGETDRQHSDDPGGPHVNRMVPKPGAGRGSTERGLTSSTFFPAPGPRSGHRPPTEMGFSVPGSSRSRRNSQSY